jgi:hypothetical protein
MVDTRIDICSRYKNPGHGIEKPSELLLGLIMMSH